MNYGRSMRNELLQNDGQLLKLMQEECCFKVIPGLDRDKEWQRDMIEYFLDCYNNTDQDTVLFAPEFKIVVGSILGGMRPTKLHYLTDFEGEEK